MSDAVLVALIAAVPSTLTFMLTAAVVYHAWRVPHRLEELVDHTNGLTEKLMGQTAIASRAEGIQSEKSRAESIVAADVSTQNAVVILAAAQLAADKILAAAKLAKG